MHLAGVRLVSYVSGENPVQGWASRQHEPVYQPLQCIAIDIIGRLPVTDKGNQYIMVVGDYF